MDLVGQRGKTFLPIWAHACNDGAPNYWSLPARRTHNEYRSSSFVHSILQSILEITMNHGDAEQPSRRVKAKAVAQREASIAEISIKSMQVK